jgi:hypothetical protein
LAAAPNIDVRRVPKSDVGTAKVCFDDDNRVVLRCRCIAKNGTVGTVDIHEAKEVILDLGLVAYGKKLGDVMLMPLSLSPYNWPGQVDRVREAFDTLGIPRREQDWGGGDGYYAAAGGDGLSVTVRGVPSVVAMSELGLIGHNAEAVRELLSRSTPGDFAGQDVGR